LSVTLETGEQHQLTPKATMPYDSSVNTQRVRYTEWKIRSSRTNCI